MNKNKILRIITEEVRLTVGCHTFSIRRNGPEDITIEKTNSIGQNVIDFPWYMWPDLVQAVEKIGKEMASENYDE